MVSTFQLAVAHWLEAKRLGKLIVTSSIATLMGLPMAARYAATKAAVEGLIRTLAIEFARAGIQANTILPGFIETEMSLDTPNISRTAPSAAPHRARSGSLRIWKGSPSSSLRPKASA